MNGDFVRVVEDTDALFDQAVEGMGGFVGIFQAMGIGRRD
jgi:hypothetical protein